jgi:hypothetical protein
VVLSSLHSHNYKFANQYSLSYHCASLQNDCLQELLLSRSMIACQCISKLDQSQPQSVFRSWVTLGLPVHVGTYSIMASQCISEFPHYSPPIASPILLDHDLKVPLHSGLIMASMCISTFSLSRPFSACPNTHNYGLQVDL